MENSKTGFLLTTIPLHDLVHCSQLLQIKAEQWFRGKKTTIILAIDTPFP